MAEDPETTTPEAAPRQGTQNKIALQLNKLKDANERYKNLLKLAKDRITKQEEEMEAIRAENKRIKDQAIENAKNTNNNTTTTSSSTTSMMASNTTHISTSSNYNNMADEGGGMSEFEENASSISCVRQRIRDSDTIWALFDFEIDNPESPDPPKRYSKWKRFDTESALQDFIRRDTGEPLLLPAFSLSPEQSELIQKEAKQSVSQVTEEFRRFRVRAEVQRKQTDAHIRDLQSANVATAKRRIEGEDFEKELELARSDHAQLELLKNELAAQEAQWKEAYDVLVAENNSLRASGSEALLAAQWRQRYEHLLTEKEHLESRLQMEVEKADATAEQRRKVDAGKYELKYRDLKESFRLYRKKAKEIFEAQQRGDIGLLNIAEKGSEDAKLSYIRNLLVNYLSSDVAVREHMEGAIGTVLKFTPEDISKIEKKKAENEAWF